MNRRLLLCRVVLTSRITSSLENGAPAIMRSFHGRIELGVPKSHLTLALCMACYCTTPTSQRHPPQW